MYAACCDQRALDLIRQGDAGLWTLARELEPTSVLSVEQLYLRLRSVPLQRPPEPEPVVADANWA